MKSKLFIAGLIILVSVVADQVTKLWAESVLASPRYEDHRVELVVDSENDGATLDEFVHSELTWTSERDKALIAGRQHNASFVFRDDVRLRPDTVLSEGDTLAFQLKTATIVDGFWDHHYARNPGAAFSFMADAPETIRKTFFISMSFLAVIAIGFFIIRTHPEQRRLVVALALVLGGAVGNLIDRVAYGYVIDFIAWHVGDAYWPTFNIADAVICVGIGLLFIEMVWGYKEEPDEEKAVETAKPEAADA